MTRNDAEPWIVAIMMDRSSQSVTFVRSDRKEAVFPLDNSMFEKDSILSSAIYYPRLFLLHLKTRTGETIQAELPSLESPSPLNGRHVIYLDQKDWSILANRRYSQELLSDSEVTAVDKLLALVEQKKVVLPVSSGHVAETLKWSNNKRRHHLALTMAQLSNGWQMRDPLDVRRLELRRTFIERFSERSFDMDDTITLAPFALHGTRGEDQGYSGPPDFPPGMRFATEALTSTMAHIDTLLNVEQLEMGASPGWVAKNQQFTDWLAGESRESQQKRLTLDALFIADTKTEMAEEAARAGISTVNFSEWLHQHRDEDLRSMPSLGLFREVLFGLHLNQTRKWTENDLTDLIYLTCAAGYTDYVVAERFMAEQIAKAQQRLGRSVTIFRKLSDLVVELEHCP